MTTTNRTRILDGGFAKKTSQLSKQQILQQATTAMLTPENAQQSSVLSLIY